MSGLGRTEGRADLVEAALTDHDVSAVEETSPDAWRVFFPTVTARDAALSALRRDFSDLSFEAANVPDEDWAARSQANLRAIQVGQLVVAPPWDIEPGDIEPCALGLGPWALIVINPSMGFGTGHHATTRLCLAALQRLDLRGRSVIDVGTGSGVLAIAASLLGAADVLGIDDDPDAVQAARENAALNPDARVSLRVTDLRAATLAPADVVVANLTGGLLVLAARSLQQIVAPGGQLVLSGFMEHEEADVMRAFDGYEVTDRTREDEWLCARMSLILSRERPILRS